MAGRRGTWLIVLGAALLVLSLGVLAYSELTAWQHALQQQAGAPPTEVLPSRLAVPSPRVSGSQPAQPTADPAGPGRGRP